MERIEKIENIIKDDSVSRTIMTLSDGTKSVQAEVYLAYIDNLTSKRYIVYTTDLDKTENEKGTFTLATLRFNQNEYILEETTKEDHQEIELKALNVIGLSRDKSPAEVKSQFQKELPNLSMIDLVSLKNNVDQMTISSEKPPKKANMPMAIANVIKKYYLFELNMELKKIYGSVSMSNEQIINSEQKLNKIDNKLDELKEVYEAHAIKNGGENKKIESNLDEIEKAKEDIIEAKRMLDVKSMESVPQESDYDQGIELNPILPESDVNTETANFDEQDREIIQSESDVEPSQVEQDSQHITAEPVQTEPATLELNSEVKPQEVEPQKVEPQIDLSQSQQEINHYETNSSIVGNTEDLENKKQNIVDKSVDKFGYSVEAIVNQLTSGISSIYEEELQQVKTENNTLKQQIKSSEEEKSEILTMLEGVKNTALEASEKAKKSKDEINDLKSQNVELQKENSDLKSTVDSQKQLLDQQNSNMEALREEGKNRETNLLQEMESLKQEINRLKQYEGAYNQIVGMVNSQRTSEPENNITK